MLGVCACVGFGVSLGLWVYWIVSDTSDRLKSQNLLAAALGLSHSSFIMLCLHTFFRG